MKKLFLILVGILLSAVVSAQYGLGKTEKEIRSAAKVSNTIKKDTLSDGYTTLDVVTDGLTITYFFSTTDSCICIGVLPDSYETCEYFYNEIKKTYTKLDKQTWTTKIDGKNVILDIIFMPDIMEHVFLFYFGVEKDIRLKNL